MNKPLDKTRRFLTARQLAIGSLVLLGVAGLAVYQSTSFGLPLPTETNTGQALSAGNPTVLPVNATPIQSVDSIRQTRYYTGTVRARRRSDVAFEIPGKVTNIMVDEGVQVEAGQVIAELDTATLVAQQAATLAQLAQAESVMNELDAGPRQETIQAARADASAAKSEHESALTRLRRRTALVKTKAVPVEEYDQARFDARTTEARLRSANQRLAELEAGTRSERLAAQQANVRQLKAAAREMEVAISKSQLVAPYSGTITRRYLDQGSIVQPTSAVCRLVESDQLEAWVGLPPEVASQLTIGSEYSLTVSGGVFPVRAAAKVGELDMTTRTQTVLFEFLPGAADSIVSGQLCQIRITTTVDSSGFWIPNPALAKGVRGLSSVLVLEPVEGTEDLFRVRKRDIEIIVTDADRVLARGTIVDGDLIVADGIHRITDGQLVNHANPVE